MINKTTSSNSRVCKICNSSDIHLYCEKNNYSIIRCSACGCGFLDLEGSSFDPYSFYQTYYRNGKAEDTTAGYDDYYSLEKALRLSFKRRLKTIFKYLKKDFKRGALLDIGCGPGFFLKIASKDFDTFGVEIAKNAADYAKRKLNLNVVNSGFRPEIFEPKKFDIITLWDTIEHIDNPHNLLKGIRGILKDNGILSFTTGDIGSIISLVSKKKWHLLTVPEHLFFFSRKGIRKLLVRYGFKIIYLGLPSSYITLDYLFERIIKSLDFGKRYRKYGNIRNLLSRIIIKANLYDVMFVIALKIPQPLSLERATRRLIINADDFGLTAGINRGIINCYNRGAVSSASIVAVGKSFDGAIKLAKEHPGLELGIHLVLVEEKPVLLPKDIPSLVTPDGNFLPNYKSFIIRFFLNKIKLNEVENELRAQIEKVINAGVKISHIDSHQYLHIFPPLLNIVIRLTSEFKIKFIRLPKTNIPTLSFKVLSLYLLSLWSKRHLNKNNLSFVDAVEGVRTAGRLNYKQLEIILSRLREGTTELICHPGIIDEEYLRSYRHWNYRPEEEVDCLCSHDLKSYLREKGIRIINYNTFAKEKENLI